MSAWTRAVFAAACTAVTVALAGCGGSGARPASPTSVLSPAANVTATATTPARPAFIATATPDANEPAPPCRVEDLQVASRGPVGATAMMSLSLIVANLGPYACALPPPISVSFRDPTNRHLLADSNRLARDLTLTTIRPTRPLRIDDVSPPAGSGYIWMLWTWRGAQGPCAVYDPPLVTVVATFAEFELEAPVPIKLGVCEGSLGIAGFGRSPPAD